jgi:hypothetical protein
MYGGPRVVVLLMGLVAFATPYVGRVAMYGLVSRAEGAVRYVEQVGLEDLLKDPRDPTVIRRPPLDRLPQPRTRTVLELLVKWDQGVWHTVLAGVLVAYNLGVYRLISRVGPLRDEEERSGFAPAWSSYRALVWVHRVVCVLFYVSLASFLWNLYTTLATKIVVLVPAAG